jgi:hypothetical protein
MTKHRQEESLFVVSEQTGQIAPAIFDNAERVSVSIEERNIRLQNVITYLAEKSMLEGFVSHRAPSEASYGEAAEEVREKAQSKIADITHKAKVEFAHASGHFQLIESGESRIDVADLTRTMFSNFLKEYYGASKYQKAQKYRKLLAGNVAILQTNDTDQSVSVVVEETTQPHQNIPEQDEKLDNHQKLEVLLTDPRAKFLPATNREKTTALTLLSYLDSDKATAEQLLEVFVSAQKVKGAGVSKGLRALESLVYEMGDYYQNATTSLEHLENLENLTEEIFNPNLSLELAIDDLECPGYPPLLRYVTLKKMYEAKEKKVRYYQSDPMVTVEDRVTKVGPGKHKTIHDRYTTPHPIPEIKEQIKLFVSSTSIGEIRKILGEARLNEQYRAQFFKDRITEVGNLTTVSRLFRNIAFIAEEVIRKQDIES